MIKRIINKILGSNPPGTKDLLEELRLKGYLSSDESSILTHLKVEIRKPAEKVFLKIGRNSVIHGTFVFETENGNATIGNNTFIGGGTFISIDGIEIGDDVMFSWGCTVMDNNAHSLRWKERANDVRDWKRGLDEKAIGKYKDWSNVRSEKIRIKNKAWIGFNSIILKGVTIGEGAVIAAGSVVTKDVPDWTVVAGNPAQVIRTIPENER